MVRIEFSANQTHLPRWPQPRPPPPSGQDETRYSVDYISQLPDTIILHIFSFLTTKDAIRTSVLSKRWRSTWTANAHTSFFMPYCDSRRMFRNFMAFMDAVLLRYTAIKVKSFHFDAPFANFQELSIDGWLQSAIRPTIDRWLHFAVGHDVEEVSMTLFEDNIYVLPQFLFDCTTLVSFHLSCCCFTMIGVVNWYSLKRLHIENAELEDDAMMRVLSGCPVLEFFELKGCWGLEHIKVESRALRELVIDSHNFRHGQHATLEMYTPHLLKLHLLGKSIGGEFKLDEVSSLVEAELNFEISTFEYNIVKTYDDLVKGLLEKLHHVTRLVIGTWCLKVLSFVEERGMFLPSLECQHLTFPVATDHEGIAGTEKILESSPRLEKLILQMTDMPIFGETTSPCNFDIKEFWNSEKQRIRQCLMHLKNVKIVDPRADWLVWGHALSMLKFLFQNAPYLDNIEINSNNSRLFKAADPWLLLEVARIILSYPNRSPSLKVILSYPSQGCPSKMCISWSSN
ncbi:hypothetical protein BT93_E2178 [Corymbia citriodora subsp. variegata]|nr:hypothetical protein BT93_E2178 [Corymbia citriodora subsp. variegata]